MFLNGVQRILSAASANELGDLDRSTLTALRRATGETVDAGSTELQSPSILPISSSYCLMMGGDWNRPYSRETACFPAGAFRVDKYWPPVNRVDNVYGDRNLFCVCAPMETYVKAAE